MKRVLACACLLAAAGCGTTPSGAPTMVPSPPSYAGTIGVPVHASAQDGATAEVVLNSFRVDTTGHILGAALIVNLTFTGTSPTPFRYDESSVTWSYAGNPDPYSGEYPGQGAIPFADYTPYAPPAPLRGGAVAAGKSVNGLVYLDVGSAHKRVLVRVIDPDDVERTEAAWLIQM